MSAAFPYTEQQSAEARPYRLKHFQYRSFHHRLFRGWQQSELHRRIAQHPDVEMPQLPCRSRLCIGVSKPPDGMMGNNDHHAAPEQIGEDIPKGAVKHA
ncbi:Uncharacterised protein [Dorea longicatena]|nr:Uncharacterised protein [Dorea longicatena]